MSKQFGIYTWSWDTVKGIKIKGNFGAPSYCINGKCEIPEHDEEGKVEVIIDGVAYVATVVLVELRCKITNIYLEHFLMADAYSVK